MKSNKIYLLAIILFAPHFIFAQDSQYPDGLSQDILKYLDQNTPMYGDMAHKIWEYAELGYLETKSSTLLQNHLKKEGFNVKTGVAGIPTAFVAEYGKGQPVIGILAEFDALPGISQAAVPERKEVEKGVLVMLVDIIYSAQVQPLPQLLLKIG